MGDVSSKIGTMCDTVDINRHRFAKTSKKECEEKFHFLGVFEPEMRERRVELVVEENPAELQLSKEVFKRKKRERGIFL